MWGIQGEEVRVRNEFTACFRRCGTVAKAT